jgi:hypothetical protein
MIHYHTLRHVKVCKQWKLKWLTWKTQSLTKSDTARLHTRAHIQVHTNELSLCIRSAPREHFQLFYTTRITNVSLTWTLTRILKRHLSPLFLPTSPNRDTWITLISCIQMPIMEISGPRSATLCIPSYYKTSGSFQYRFYAKRFQVNVLPHCCSMQYY